MPTDLLIANIWMTVFGLLAAYLVNLPVTNKWRRYGCISGLIAEPGWFWAGYATGQWGIILLAFVYGCTWVVGIWNNWFCKQSKTV
jgi:hypothetical protein